MKKDLAWVGFLLLLTILFALASSVVWGNSKTIGFVEIRGTVSIADIILTPFTYLGMLTFWKWCTKKP